MTLFVFYGVFFGVALAITVAAFTFTRRLTHSAAVALAVSLGVATVETLLFPIPIHGGFTFLLEVAIDELKTQRRGIEDLRDHAADRAFLGALETRFARALEFEVVDRRSDGWERVLDEAGNEGWLEPRSGLVWRGPLIWNSAPPEPSLEEATAFCAAQPPSGRWALPTDGDLLTLWRSNGHVLMPGDGRSSLTRMVDVEMRLELRTKFVGQIPGYSLRCAARSEAAPRRGYVSADFPLEERNRFQLEKAVVFK